MKTLDHPVRLRRRILLSGAALLGAAVAVIGLYHGTAKFMLGASGRPPVAVAPPGAETDAASSGVARFSFLDHPRVVPDLQFTDGDGRALSLADFRNRPVLLNIWATWCVPCRKEMPSLDRLQAELGASQLLVLPVSIDREGLPVVQKFYRELGLAALGVYLDKTGRAASAVNTVGVPTTILIDRDGREIARKVGAAAWDDPALVALIRQHLGLAASGRKAGP